MERELAQAVGRDLGNELSRALDCIRHCLEQLTDDQVWQRPAKGMNSIGNLLLHLTGNVRQWLVAGLTGAPDVRNRPGEFGEHPCIPASRLRAGLLEAVADARAILAARSTHDWLGVRRIQGFDVTGLEAAVNSVAHFRGHTQEIIHITRSLLGDRYRFAWTPTKPEEGAQA